MLRVAFWGGGGGGGGGGGVRGPSVRSIQGQVPRAKSWAVLLGLGR